MKLYRYLSLDELTAIINRNLSQVGSVNLISKYSDRNNNHKYLDDVRYLHFYFAEKEIQRITTASFLDKKTKYYVCEFEIPFYHIFNNIGLGYYASKKENKYADYVFEVALPIYKMRTRYLKRFKEYSNIKEQKWIDFDYSNREEFLNNVEQLEK